MKLTDQERVQRAKDAVNNPVLAETFELLRQGYLKQLMECPDKDDMGRFRYTVALHVVNAVHSHLKQTADLGLFEQSPDVNPKRKVFSLF